MTNIKVTDITEEEIIICKTYKCGFEVMGDEDFCEWCIKDIAEHGSVCRCDIKKYFVCFHCHSRGVRISGGVRVDDKGKKI